MKRFQDHNFWYEITAQAEGGRSTRVYRVTCRHCGCLTTFRAAMLAEERVRKQLIRDGWEIGRHIKAHACPACSHRRKDRTPLNDADVAPKPVPAPTPAPTSMELLETAWLACSEQDRETFALEVYQKYFVTEPPHSEEEHKDSPETAVADNSNSEPADWWLEIHSTN